MPYRPSSAALSGRLVVGQRIRGLRTSRGLTQESLALAAGWDRSFLVDVENGRHSFMVDRLFDLADALDVAASDLLGDPTVEDVDKAPATQL